MSELEQLLQEILSEPDVKMEFSSILNEQVQTPVACVQNNDDNPLNDSQFHSGINYQIIYDDTIFISNVFEIGNQSSYSETQMCWYDQSNLNCLIMKEAHNWTIQQAGNTCEAVSISTATSNTVSDQNLTSNSSAQN